MHDLPPPPPGLPHAGPPSPLAPLGMPQVGRATIRFGRRFRMKAEVRVTPAGLLAIGGLVSAILLSTAPLVRAAVARRAD